jgi:hypothetical protein
MVVPSVSTGSARSAKTRLDVDIWVPRCGTGSANPNSFFAPVFVRQYRQYRCFFALQHRVYSYCCAFELSVAPIFRSEQVKE